MHIPATIVVFTTLWLATNSLSATAEVRGCSATSTDKTTVLIELFTSEGCNSCPPADRWLAEIGKSRNAIARVVPLAFHVDYWNYLGWEDPYAMPQFTQRQQRYAAYARTRTIYTPQVFLNGREFRAWRSGNAGTRIAEASQVPARTPIAINLSPHQAHEIQIDAEVGADADREEADLYLALFENDLSNKIDDGENAGRTLHHDYVTRRLLGPIALEARGETRHRAVMRVDREWKRKNMGVAAFVQRREDGVVLQALALPLCF